MSCSPSPSFSPNITPTTFVFPSSKPEINSQQIVQLMDDIINNKKREVEQNDEDEEEELSLTPEEVERLKNFGH